MNYNIKEFFMLSNMLSMLRLIMSVPIFFLLGGLEGSSYSYRLLVAFILLFTASTDWMDGYFARKYNEVTELGKIIDPLADKIALGAIVIQLFILGDIPEYLFYSVIIRDVLIFFGGIYVSKKLNRVLPSNMLGKITVTVLAFFMLAIVLQLNVHAPFIYDLLEYTGFILVIVSFIGYCIRAYETLNWKKHGSV